jgi:ABC-type transport system involved in multi-copper enzyme maturation permease subunit
MPLLTIAGLTLCEAVRRRLLLAVFILTVIIIGATGWGFSRIATFTRNGQPISHVEVLSTTAEFVLLIAIMFSFILAVGSAFLAAPSIAADVESGLALALLPRPIRRSDVVLGKWLGMTALLAGYTALVSLLELAVIRVVTGYTPPHPVMAVLFLIGQAVVLLTLAILGSTRLPSITGGIIALVLFGVAWIFGIVTQVGATFHNATITTAGTIVSLVLPTDGLWHGVQYNLQPAAITALANAQGEGGIVTGAAPTTPYIVWAVAWVVVMLLLAVRSFARRDL